VIDIETVVISVPAGGGGAASSVAGGQDAVLHGHEEAGMQSCTQYWVLSDTTEADTIQYT